VTQLSIDDKNHSLVTDEITWLVHLGRRQWYRSLIIMAIILAAALVVQMSARNPVLTILAIVLLVAAVAEYIFPIHYRLNRTGVEMRNFLTWRRMRWHEVHRCTRGPQGIKISPLRRPDWREPFRGIHIWVEGEEQERLVEAIRNWRALAQTENTQNSPATGSP
jgi:hypothetical protein